MAAAGYAQDIFHKIYKPGIKKGTAKAYLEDIHKQTGVIISYSEAHIRSDKKLSLPESRYEIASALRIILEDMPVQFAEKNDKILIFPASVGILANPPPPADITINGYIRDSSTREALIGAALYIPELGTGTVTNNHGFYSLTLPTGRYHVLVSYIGYRQQQLTIQGEGNHRTDILMGYIPELEEVFITDSKEKPSDHRHLNAEAINSYTSLLGDNDIMRALQHTPGVQPGIDGSTGLIVRGGEQGQNLSLLDGVPLYYTDHFMGISSIYNTDAIKSADFYTGAFPSRYGGRISSIMDVNTRDGDMEHLGGQVKLGLLNGSLSLEGPVVKNKASAIVTARRSWIDLLWRPFDNSLGFDFYDINAKANLVINNANRLFLSVYNGRDQFRVSEEDNYSRSRWGNTFIALKENAILGPKVFLHTTATYSAYRYTLNGEVPAVYYDTTISPLSYEGKSTVKEQAIRMQLYWYPTPAHHIEAGFRYANASFAPATTVYNDGQNYFENAASPMQRFTSNEAVAYVEDEITAGNRWKFRLGLHWANWFNGDYTYPSLQPRLFASYRATKSLTFFASASRMAQFLHMFSNNPTGFSSDVWLPSTKTIKPEIATSGNIGFNVRAAGELEYGVELYYKDMRNLLSTRFSGDLFSNMIDQTWEQQLTQGSGRGYGAEFHVSKQFGPLWLSGAYTLARSERKFAELNNGETFPFRYDRRHNLHMDGVWQPGKGITINVGFTYLSGSYISVPDQTYPDFDNALLNGLINFGNTYNYSSVNNYRLPALHHLDFAVNFVKKKGARYRRTITLGMYNLYGRRNLVGTGLNTDDNGNLYLTGYSITRFIPTLSYQLQF